MSELGGPIREALSHTQKLYKLVQDAAPLIAIAAQKGGSLFYQSWLDRAKDVGVMLDEGDRKD